MGGDRLVTDQLFRRKLTAIMAADVVGYSGLMAADETDTLSRLKAIQRRVVEPRVRVAGGRIVKTMGDGFLIEFGSALSAVSCALNIQSDMIRAEEDVAEQRRVRFRIGINLGDVIHEKGDVFGDGVNVAARLEQLAQPGGICVSRNVFDQVRDRLPIDHEDMGARQLKGIAHATDVYALRSRADYVASPIARPARIRLAAVIVVLVALIAAGGAALVWQQMQADRPVSAAVSDPARARARLSIAVLPFASLSDDSDQEYFADGITEDLTTDLSRISGAFVIARNTALTYKGKTSDVRKIGEELGVRYVLEGSVRRAGGRVRVNAQLVEVETGLHVWAERFDREEKDVFAVQSEITGRIARTLNLQLIEAESRKARAGGPANLEAYDLALQGWVLLLNKPQTADTNRDAEKLIRRAIELDGRSALAWTAMSYIHTRAANFGWTSSPSQALADAIAAGERAVELDSQSSDASYMLGFALRSSGQVERSMAVMERSVALNPNNPLPYQGLAYAKILMGQAEEAPALIEQAFRLSPREPLAAIWLWTAAHAHLLKGDDAGSIKTAGRAIGVNPRYPRPYLTLAAAAGNLDRHVEAQAAVADYLRHTQSEKTLTDVAQYWQSLSPNPTYRRQTERFLAGLRKAGMPDR
jgi:TolB-like protein/class 3 adenylate cyclase